MLLRFPSLVLQAAVGMGLMLANFNGIPLQNTQQKTFDVIVVLGTPCTAEGKPSLEQRERVLEGVREYKAHVAPEIIMTGAAAHNQFVEAHCMKELAVSEGVPADKVIEEPQAKDTIQNIWFSEKLMEQHGWHSADVVSSPMHLPRTALILKHYPFQWRVHASKWPPEYTAEQIRQRYAGEIRSCWTLTHTGFKHNQFLPGS